MLVWQYKIKGNHLLKNDFLRANSKLMSLLKVNATLAVAPSGLGTKGYDD